jgi:hypothetical protein
VRYVVARDHYQEGDVSLGRQESMGEAYPILRTGGRVGAAWPKRARLFHNAAEAIPLGKLNKNAVANSFDWLIVDARYKAILEPHDCFELLPVELQIAPRKLVKDGWWIANPIDVREAVDRERSVWKPHVEPGKIRLFKKLVLTNKSIADRPVAFRLKEMPEASTACRDHFAIVQVAGWVTFHFSVDGSQVASSEPPSAQVKLQSDWRPPAPHGHASPSFGGVFPHITAI